MEESAPSPLFLSPALLILDLNSLEDGAGSRPLGLLGSVDDDSASTRDGRASEGVAMGESEGWTLPAGAALFFKESKLRF